MTLLMGAARPHFSVSVRLRGMADLIRKTATSVSKRWNSVQQELTMPQFDPELIQLMRTVLEDAMTRVPLEISGTTTKAYLAEVILKAAAQGHTSYSDLITAATDQIHTLTSMLM